MAVAVLTLAETMLVATRLAHRMRILNGRNLAHALLLTLRVGRWGHRMWRSSSAAQRATRLRRHFKL